MAKLNSKKLRMAHPSFVVSLVVLCLSLAKAITFVSADDDTLDTITTTEFGKPANQIT